MSTPVHVLVQRRRWTAAEARRVLDALERSGKSVRAFAEEHGLDPQRLYMWRGRVAAGDGITFHEVKVRGADDVAGAEARSDAFEVALGSRVVVRVPSAFDAVALARLLDVLARTASC